MSIASEVGKEKPEQESLVPSAKYSKTTLFVRQVPFASSTKDLELFFAEFGPLHSCFLVASPRKNVMDINSTTSSATFPEVQFSQPHAGYGFVKFVSEQDAQACVQALSKRHGVPRMIGRRLRVEFAISRHALQEREAHKKQHQRKNIIIKKSTLSEQPLFKVFASITQNEATSDQSISMKALEARLRKAAGKPHEILDFDGHRATLVYKRESDALRVVKKLSGRPFLVRSIKQQQQFTMSLVLLDPALKQHRLIVRNLPFSCTKNELMNLFGQHGTIIELDMPVRQSASDDAQSTFKGFAFVQFMFKTQAEQALTTLNGNKVDKRPMRIDWAIPAKLYTTKRGDEQETETKGKRVKLNLGDRDLNDHGLEQISTD